MKVRENIAYKAHDSTRIADIWVYGEVCCFPDIQTISATYASRAYFDLPTWRANFSFGRTESMRQTISPVAITDMDTDNTKYGNAKLISPFAHNEPFGKDVCMMNMKPIASDPR